jgi:amidase
MFDALRRHSRLAAGSCRRRMLLRLAILASLAVPTSPMAAQRRTAPQTIDLDAATIADINAAFDAGTVSSEQLVQRYLARIAAFDQQGPRLNAIIALNPRAIETARALDAERKRTGRRSALHGIPIVLKDNFDTHDLPTTAGSVLLAGWMPPADATVVKALRDAGAIVLAKVNMSEFASGGTYSSLGGQTRNPHDLARSPSGSSGGTGAAVAAGFAQFGLGTDTGGSIRGPATANGIVALKPTHGLLSRTGIIPLALTFDTGGPMSRSVTDIAIVLGALTGIDAADSATQKSVGHAERDYTTHLQADALRGARIGVARDVLGQDPEIDWIVESSLDAMRQAGATIIDVRFPKWLLDTKQEWYNAIRFPEFPVQIAAYLKRTPATYPKSLDEMIGRARALPSLGANGAGPNASRWTRFVREQASGSLDDYRYTAVRDHALPLVRDVVNGILAAQRLDAIVYPTASRKPPLIAAPPDAIAGLSVTDIANLTGFPDLIVPAGFTDDRLPVGLSFLGTAWSEGRLIALGYSFEQRTKARRRPVHTPALTGEAITSR